MLMSLTHIAYYCAILILFIDRPFGITADQQRYIFLYLTLCIPAGSFVGTVFRNNFYGTVRFRQLHKD